MSPRLTVLLLLAACSMRPAGEDDERERARAHAAAARGYLAGILNVHSDVIAAGSGPSAGSGD